MLLYFRIDIYTIFLIGEIIFFSKAKWEFSMKEIEESLIMK